MIRDIRQYLLFVLRSFVLVGLRVSAFLVFLFGATINVAYADNEILQADPSAQNLTLVDGIDRFKRQVFLKQATLGGVVHWIDNRTILAPVPPEPDRNPGHPKLPLDSWILIDTETGAIEKLPWNDDGWYTMNVCYNNGRIAFKQIKRVAEKQWSTVWHVGKFGQKLATYSIENTLLSGEIPQEWKDQGVSFDHVSCRLVKRLTHFKKNGVMLVWPEWYQGGSVAYLEPEHGWLIDAKPNRANGSPGDYALVTPEGRKIPIPITGGEREFHGSLPRYLAFADGYFVHPHIMFSSPHHVWTPHFARLIHPDGRVDRFSVPGPLFERVSSRQGGGAKVSAIYSRRGVLWEFSPNPSDPDSHAVTGNYLVIGQELVRVAQHLGSISPDGCKLFGRSERTLHQWKSRTVGPADYFVIDLCKE